MNKDKSAAFRHNSPLFFAQNASGPLRFNMTNDYMFRAVLQTNNKVLRGLICTLLHLSEEEVASVRITNPIILGEAIDDKEFRLDINVLLNDYTLFEDSPEFYATYKLINVKNHKVYNDNFVLSVVNLSHIDLATDEDKRYQIDYWAKLFKAATWEEIHMLACENDYINKASNTMLWLSAEEDIRKRCQDREEYYRDIRTYNKIIAEKDSLLAEQSSLIRQLLEENKRLKENMNK